MLVNVARRPPKAANMRQIGAKLGHLGQIWPRLAKGIPRVCILSEFRVLVEYPLFHRCDVGGREPWRDPSRRAVPAGAVGAHGAPPPLQPPPHWQPPLPPIPPRPALHTLAPSCCLPATDHLLLAAHRAPTVARLLLPAYDCPRTTGRLLLRAGHCGPLLAPTTCYYVPPTTGRLLLAACHC